MDVPKYNKTALHQAVRDRDAQFQRLAFFATASNLNELLIQACEEIFPSQLKESVVKWESQPVRMRLQQFWQARRNLQKAKVNLALRGIMKVWVQYTHFQRSYKQLKREGRHARKQILLNKPQQASASGQVSRLYKVVRNIAPKTFQKAVRIHDERGCILSTGEEHGAIMTDFQQFYAANAPAVQVHSFDVQDVFTEADVRLALSATQIGKAAPKGAAPSSSWKACSKVLAGAITEIANSCLAGNEALPPHWLECQLALLPKPNKSVKRPESLRPVGLQDAASKAFSRMVKCRLYEQVESTLQRFPQCAYLPHRTTMDAIYRVVQHCRAVRLQHEQQVTTVHTRQQGLHRVECGGGAQMALDMTTALDRVPHGTLVDALRWAGATEQMIHIILQLHNHCTYVIQHGPHVGRVNMMRGVKQGCTLAPLLWAIYSTYLAHLIGNATDYDWMLRCMTLYADDTHLHWSVSCTRDLVFMRKCIQVIFRIYQEHGMKVNPHKSTFISGVIGKVGRQWLRNRQSRGGIGRTLDFGTPGQPLLVPQSTTLKYLGVIVSYQRFEDQTLASRLQSASVTRHRLLKVLHASRFLPVQKRLQLYMACVRSTALYGIPVIGITPKGVRQLQAFEAKHVRAIARFPVHLTRETTVSLFQRLGLLPAMDHMCKMLEKALTAPEATWQREALERLQILSGGHSVQPASFVTREISCPVCGLYFAGLQAMKIHHTKMHGSPSDQTKVNAVQARGQLNVYEHSLDGMPTCILVSIVCRSLAGGRISFPICCRVVLNYTEVILSGNRALAMRRLASHRLHPARRAQRRSCRDRHVGLLPWMRLLSGPPRAVSLSLSSTGDL